MFLRSPIQRMSDLAEFLFHQYNISQHERGSEWNYFLFVWNDMMALDAEVTHEEVLNLWDEYLSLTDPPDEDVEYFF